MCICVHLCSVCALSSKPRNLGEKLCEHVCHSLSVRLCVFVRLCGVCLCVFVCVCVGRVAE